MSATSRELLQELEAKRRQLKTMYDEMKDPGKFTDRGAQALNDKATREKIDEFQRLSREVAALDDEFEAKRIEEQMEAQTKRQNDLNEVMRRTGAQPNSKLAAYEEMLAKSVGKRLSDFLINSKGYEERDRTGNKFTVELKDYNMGEAFKGVTDPAFQFKTLMSESAGFAPANPRTSRVVLSAQRKPVVSDLIPTDPTDLQVVKWMLETTFTNSASSVSEGGSKPESALAYTEQSSTVDKIATWIPVTEEQLDDVGQIRNIIDNRLVLMLLLIEENILLYGNGVAPNMQGFFNANIQTQAFSTSNIDTTYLAMTLVRFTGFAEPSGVIMHPNNWQTIRLAKASGSGLYLLGNPQDDTDARLFGKPVIVTPAINANQGLVGDFSTYAHISRKMGVRIDVADQHQDYFVKNLLAIRAEMRESLEIYRPSAFCGMTSLT